MVKKGGHCMDIGTAEGNHFLRLSPCIKSGVGIDIEEEMIRLARTNKKEAKAGNIEFKIADANKLPFPDKEFDVVVVKHSLINFDEAHRVLKTGGILMTQQVHETDKANLKRMFQRGQGYGEKAGLLLERYKQEANKAGFKKIRASISNIPYYFVSEKRLLRFLEKTPTIPDFGKKSGDTGKLEEFIRKNKTEKGIKSNTSRFLLEMKTGFL